MKLRNMMIQKIEIFVFILSVIFCLKHLIGLIMMLTQEDPTQISIGKVEKVLLYLSSSYIVTSVISIIFL
jgi:hypothetical protein